MALTDEQKQRIEANIKRLDYLEGTGFISTNRKHLAQEFFLFIGAGGTGCRALAKLKKTMKNQVDHFDVEKQTMFLAIDTAHQELDESVKKGEFEKNEVLKIPYVGAHDSINPERIMPQLKAWVHESLWKKTGGTNEVSRNFNGTGAGAIRQCGRVLFSQSAVQSELFSKLARIRECLAGMEVVPEIKVFFLCGIAGGTGSGIILDLAFLTRHFLKSILLANYDRTTLSAYLFLPSACGNSSDLNTDDVANGNRNSYAALKEIDHYMTMTSRSERFVMDYGTVDAGNVDIGDDIFNFCTLVEGVGSGGKFFKDNAETSRQIVADSILNIICVSNQQKVGGKSMFLVDSFLSNEVAKVENRIEARNDRNWPRDANYIYSVIGYSSCVVPVDLLTVYVAKKVFDEVFGRFSAADVVNEELAAVFLEDCGLGLKELARNWKTIRRKQLITDIQTKADEHFKDMGPYYMVNLTKAARDLIISERRDFLHEALRRQNSKIANKEKWEVITQFYNEAADYLGRINTELYEVYSYAITVFGELLEKNVKLLTDTKEYENQFGKSFFWSPIDMTPGEQATRAVAEYLDEMLDEKAVKRTARKFMDDLCEKRDEWTGIMAGSGQSRPKMDVAKAVRDFIAENLKECVNTTLEQFIVKAYSGKKDAEVFQVDPGTGREICSEETKNAAEQVFLRLNNNADALASTRNFRLSDCYSNVFLTVPGNCKWFSNAISQVVSGNQGSDRIEVYPSSAADRIVLCRLYAGVPAWALYWTPGAEECYEGNNGDGVNTVGLHMDQGENGKDWSKLPNLYPEKLWTDMQRRARKREEGISKRVHDELLKARQLSMLVGNERDKTYLDVILLEKDRTAEELFQKAALNVKKKYDFGEVLDILVEKGELTRFKIEFINQVMTTTDDLTDDQLEEFRFDLAARTIRRYVDKCSLLSGTITVLEKLKKLNDDRTPIDLSILALFIQSLTWELMVYDDRRNMWKLSMDDEKLIGKELQDKFQKVCAHYYGFQAFSALDEDEIQRISGKLDELKDSASNEQFDEQRRVANELKQSLTVLRNAKKSVRPWDSGSPFACANDSAWPMAAQDFVERAGSEEEAKVIREFYTELIHNI